MTVFSRGAWKFRRECGKRRPPLRRAGSIPAIMVLLLGTAAPAPAGGGPRIRAGKLRLAAGSGGRFELQLLSEPAVPATARLRLALGPGGRAIDPHFRPVRGAGAMVRLSGHSADPELDCVLTCFPRKDCLVWQVTLHNPTGKTLQLEIGPELAIRFPGPVRAFDGYNENLLRAGGKGLVMHRLRTMTPYAALWNRRAAVGTAISPEELPSWLEHRCSTGPETRLSTCTRIVLRAGEDRSLQFVIIGAPGEWGKYEIMQAYFDAFPACFLPFPGVDSRVWRGGAEYRAYPYRPDSPELCRRLGAGWEWCYAPFRRTGDIVGRRKFWDYKPARPFSKTRAMSWTAFHAWRRKAFHDGAERAGVLMAFYVPAQIWCEERLAKKYYNDALTLDPDTKIRFDTPWVTGNDNEVRVFPFCTSWAEQSRTDLREVARSLGLQAFAFDTADGTAKYRGPALARIPSRYLAWNAEGVFCCENVAVAKLMDFVHSLKTAAGRPLAVIGNIGSGVYTSDLHCDAAMFEGTPWKLFRTYPDHLRWKLGRKAAVWWESYGIEHFLQGGATPTGMQMAAMLRGLSDFTLLQSLRLGFIPPPNYTQGVARLARWLPPLLDCIRRGWQPVPAVRVPAPLWAARYGAGRNTVLALAHETGKPVQAVAAIENHRLGGGGARFLFADARGNALENRFPNTDPTTTLSLDIPVRTPRLLEAVAGVTAENGGAPFPLARAVVSVEPGAVRRRVRVALTPRTNGGRCRLHWTRPQGMRLASVQLDGRPLPVRREPGGGGSVLVQPKTGGTVVTAEFASDLFQSPEAALLDFPFVHNRRPGCRILVPPAAGPAVRRAAFRLQEYWRYWYARAVRPTCEVRIPIETRPESAAISGPAVRLRIAPGSPGPGRVSLEENTLLIEAPNGPAIEAAVFRLLALLDRRCFFPDRLPGTALNKKTGLAGKVLLPHAIADSARGLRNFPLLP